MLVMKAIFIRSIPEDLHKAFRFMCLEKNVSLNQEVKRLIAAAVKEYEKKKAKHA